MVLLDGITIKLVQTSPSEILPDFIREMFQISKVCLVPAELINSMYVKYFLAFNLIQASAD